VRVAIDDPYAGPKALLLDGVASANRCRAVWSKQLGFATLLGFEADLERVELLYSSLLVQATAAMLRAGRDSGARARSRSFRQSFLVAFASRSSVRLRDANEATVADASRDHGARLLPILAGRAGAVHDAVAHTFPGMTQHSLAVNDRAGWVAGTVAAEMANLSAHPEVRAG
jgi:hypothetical protein